MTTRRKKATLRRMMPSSKRPVAREIAELANALGSSRLHAIAEKVARLEAGKEALDAYMVTVGENGTEQP